ncbi:MAG: PEP-CTERM sorting domain-containing protein [Verrucomicrobiia bacterium]
MNTNYKQLSCLRNNRAVWLTVAAIMAGYGSSAMAQSLFESPIAPSSGVWLSQLTGGSTSSSPGASSHDYLNAVNPGEVFTIGSSETLASVTVQGNGDDGYWTGSAPNVANGLVGEYQYQPSLSSGSIGASLTPLIQWDIQIGSVSGSTITQIANESVTGWSPNSSSTFLSFNLASPLALSAGTYAFSLTFDTSTLDDFTYGSGGVWYGLAESLVPKIGSGNAFNNGTTSGTFGNVVDPSGGAYDYVFELSSNPIPEPATMALLGLGVLGMITASRRRRA